MKGSSVQVRSSALGEASVKFDFSDYDGPTGLLIATGTEMFPLDSAAGATAFVGAAMQSGTLDPEESARLHAATEAAIQEYRKAHALTYRDPPSSALAQRSTSSKRATVAGRSSGSASSRSS